MIPILGNSISGKVGSVPNSIDGSDGRLGSTGKDGKVMPMLGREIEGKVGNVPSSIDGNSGRPGRIGSDGKVRPIDGREINGKTGNIHRDPISLLYGANTIATGVGGTGTTLYCTVRIHAARVPANAAAGPTGSGARENGGMENGAMAGRRSTESAAGGMGGMKMDGAMASASAGNAAIAAAESAKIPAVGAIGSGGVTNSSIVDRHASTERANCSATKIGGPIMSETIASQTWDQNSATSAAFSGHLLKI